MRIEQAKIRHTGDSKEIKKDVKTRPSVFTGKFRGEYYNIDIDKLVPFHKQARKYFNETGLNQLASTIKAHGIRQPLTIIPKEGDIGNYEIVSGERRYKAAIIAGLKTVPCIIINDQRSAVEIALIENVQRKDLHPIELANAYSQLLEAGVCSSKTEIAEKLSIQKSVVTETMQLLILPEDIKTRLLDKDIVSRKLFRELLEQKDIAKMRNLIESYESIKQEIKVLPSPKKKKFVLKVSLSGDSVEVDDRLYKKLPDEEKEAVKEIILGLL